MAGLGRVAPLAVAAVCRVDTVSGVVDDDGGGEVSVYETEGDGRSSVEAEDGDCGGYAGDLGCADTGEYAVEDDWLRLGSSESARETDDGDRA